MKRLILCLCLFMITTLISACGKTEFSSSDASTALKAGGQIDDQVDDQAAEEDDDQAAEEDDDQLVKEDENQGCNSGNRPGDRADVRPSEGNSEAAPSRPLEDLMEDPSLTELYQCGKKKVYVCHVPPGNPAAAHTLCISVNAVPAHLKHAAATGEEDSLGECEKRSESEE